MSLSEETLTINQFLDEMEKIYDVEGIGYMKVLEKAKEMKKENEELKKENEKLKKENERHIKNRDCYEKLYDNEQEKHGNTLNHIYKIFNLDCKKQAEHHACKFNSDVSALKCNYRCLIGQWYIMCVKAGYDKMKKEITEIEEENEKLKEEIKDNEGSYDEIEYKKLKDMSKDMVKNTLICAIKESTICEEELDLKMTWGHKYIDEYRNNYDKMYQEIINELNEEDFNEDNNRSKLVLDTNRLLSYEFIDTDDETDEEDSDED